MSSVALFFHIKYKNRRVAMENNWARVSNVYTASVVVKKVSVNGNAAINRDEGSRCWRRRVVYVHEAFKAVTA